MCDVAMSARAGKIPRQRIVWRVGVSDVRRRRSTGPATRREPDDQDGRTMERVDRRSFLRLAGAGAAGAVLLRPGAAARAAQVRAAGHGPNVLVIVLDSLRADHVGAYGNNAIHTPNIDALAKQSLRFTRGFPEAMPTVPARRSLLL